MKRTMKARRGLIMRNFIVTATVFTIATCVNAAGVDVNLFKAEDYAELRKELRAFYPDECHDLLRCKEPWQMGFCRVQCPAVRDNSVKRDSH